MQDLGCGNTNQSGTDKNDNPVEESSRATVETDVQELSLGNAQTNGKERHHRRRQRKRSSKEMWRLSVRQRAVIRKTLYQWMGQYWHDIRGKSDGRY